MTKKTKILIGVILVLVIGIFGWRYVEKINDKKFLSQLKGEIVFARRDNGVLNIYKINANGTGLRLLYHNENSINPNSRLPKWSEDGKQVYFVAMKEGKWTNFVMGANGENPQILLGEPFLYKKDEKTENLLIQKGNVYWKDNNGTLHLVYRHWFQNYKLNPGASEASWSPDKKYIIFQVCSFLRGCRIMIADKKGRVAELTRGQEPDWKY